MTYLLESITPTRIYHKRCSHCGLNYLGKTTLDDIESYQGSGTHWLRHLKKHKAKAIHVWNSDWFYDKSIVDYALNLSKELNIVESKEWANMKPENGLDGGFEFINEHVWTEEKRLEHNRSISPFGSEHSKKYANEIRAGGLKGSKKRSELVSKGILDPRTFLGRTHSEETKLKMKKSKNVGESNSQFGTMWITNGEVNKKIKASNLIPFGWEKGRILRRVN